MWTYLGYILLSLLCYSIIKISFQQASQRAIFTPSNFIKKDPSYYQLQFENIKINTSDGSSLHGWFIPSSKSIATVLFFHGNAGNISNRLEELSVWHKISVNVFIIDYRGYGKSKGILSEKGIYLDAQAAYDYLIEEKKIPANKIVCFGRSLGGAAAIYLASCQNIGSLIVCSAFTSLEGLINSIFPNWLAVVLRKIITMNFASIQRIQKVNCPVLFLHGGDDALIPAKLGKILYEKARSPKMWYLVPGASHNNIFILGGRKYWYLIKSFIVKTISKHEDWIK